MDNDIFIRQRKTFDRHLPGASRLAPWKRPQDIDLCLALRHGEKGHTVLGGLRNYIVGRDGGVLKRYNGKRNAYLLCLAFGDPQSYKILYNAGRVISQQLDTKSPSRIHVELGKKFDCPISVMRRNMNWHHPNLNNVAGFFDLCAYLDQPEDERLQHLAGSFNPTLDGNLYEVNDQVKQQIIDQLTERMDAIEMRMNHVETRMSPVETRMDHVENEFEKIKSEMNESNKENAGCNGSILRKTKGQMRRVQFNEEANNALTFRDGTLYNSGVDCPHIPSLILLVVGGKNISLGVLSPGTASASRVGVLQGFSPTLRGPVHTGKVVRFDSGFIVVCGLPSKLNTNIPMDMHDGDGMPDSPGVMLRIALVDYRQESRWNLLCHGTASISSFQVHC
eukprot:scaffold202_cov180-Amphora_coffeaeformis.AAC.18